MKGGRNKGTTTRKENNETLGYEENGRGSVNRRARPTVNAETIAGGKTERWQER